MVLLEFSMFPTDKGESVSQYVARIIDVIDRSGTPYHLTSMGTILEGSWDEVMNVVTQCFGTLEPLSNRITVSIKIDYRRGNQSRMTRKVEKIKRILNRNIS